MLLFFLVAVLIAFGNKLRSPLLADLCFVQHQNPIAVFATTTITAAESKTKFLCSYSFDFKCPLE